MMFEPERTVELNPDEPLSIWMPARYQTTIPDSYRGTPLEIVQQMADNMRPGLGIHEAINLITNSLAERQIALPDTRRLPSEKIRATAFVVTLLLLGVARHTPKA